MNVVDLDRRAVLAAAALVEATSADAFDRPTPCAGWTVRDLLVHLVAGNLKYTEIARGSDWIRGAPHVELDDPAGMYRTSAETLLRAWEQPGVLERETPLPVGRGPAENALYLHLGETLVHGWDLAKATGREPAFDEDVAEASLVQYLSWLSPHRPPGHPYGEAVPIGEDSAALDRLAAYLGRDVKAWSA